MPTRGDVMDITAFTRERLLPVVSVRTPAEAERLIRLCRRCGFSAVEILLRSDFALDAIETVAAAGLRVAAGTIRSARDVEEAGARGASGVVSAGFLPEVVAHCRDQGLLYLPGVSTPSEALMAANHGLSHLKFFPAEAFGGARTLGAFAAPFPDLSFVATGGVSSANFADYLRLPNVLAVGGSWMMPLDGTGASEDEIVSRARAELSQAGSIREGAERGMSR